MSLGKWVGTVVVIAAAAATYAIYSPQTLRTWSPRLAAEAQSAHDWAWAKAESHPPGSGETASAAHTPAPAASPSASPSGAQPILVTVTPVKKADYPLTLEGLGQVQAYNTVTVKARVDGQITKIAFKEGQDVKAGDLLAEIDPRPFQAAFDQAAAKRTQDEANLANAKLDLARYTTLAKQSYATQQQLDTQNSLVNQLTAGIAADAAAIDAAKVQLGYTTIRAPLTGRVGFRLVDEGNLVSAAQQTGIVTIAQLQPISVLFTAPEDEITRINEALHAGPAPVTVANSSGEPLATGRLIVTDNQVDVNTGTIRLKAEFPNQDDKLWPGLAVTTALTVGIDRNALLLPADAIQHGQNGLYVYVVDETNHAALRNIKVSHQSLSTAVVAESVQEGDRVVTSGQFRLEPGTPVTITSAPGGS